MRMVFQPPRGGRSRGRTGIGALLGMILLAGTVLPGCFGCEPVSSAGPSKEAIGVYDSRAIAVAYAGSELHEAQLGKLKADYDAAKAAGDQASVAALENQAQDAQRLMHLQGFGTAPVDGIMEQVQGELDRIKAEAGVVALVSKWDEAGLAAHPNAARVDVTEALVDAFHPSERQRKMAIDIQRHKPVPMEELEKHIEKGDI